MRVAVVGAGLAGLACAVDLARAGVDVTVFEARDSRRRPGLVRRHARRRALRARRRVHRGRLRRLSPPRRRVRPAARATGVRVRRSRGAIRRARRCPRCCSRPSVSSQRPSTRSAPTPPRTSAADALARTPLEPLARRALRRRLEGTYTVELDRVSATWLSSAEQRAAGAAEASARLADGNDALAKAMASELGERVRLALVPVRRAHAQVEDFDRVVLAVPLPVAIGGCCRPCASAGATGGCSGASPRSCTCRSPSRPRPGAVQALGAAFWTVDDRCVDRRRLVRRRPRRARVARDPDRPRALARRPSGAAARARACAAMRCSRAGGTTIPGAAARTPAIRRGGRSETTRRSQRPAAAIHLAGEHTAAEFCGTMEGALRSGARAASEVLAEARTQRLTMSDMRSTLVTG